jgi:hypothetical protein
MIRSHPFCIFKPLAQHSKQEAETSPRLAGSIGYFISLDYNLDRAFGMCRKTMRGNESKSQSNGNHQRGCVPNFHS